MRRAGAVAMAALVLFARPAETETPLPPAAPIALQIAGITFTGAMSQGGMVIGVVPPDVVSLALDGAAVPIASDNRFLIAFGRDHEPVAMLRVTRRDGTGSDVRLAIAPGSYRIEALPIPKHQQPEAEFAQIRAMELDRIKAARETAAATASDGWEQRFIWPVNGRISGAFGAQRVYNGERGSYHSGEDIAVPTGTPVRAPADGVVVLAATEAPFTLEGHLLMIGHGMGLDSAFLHLSHIDVAVGQAVRQGQVIGESGMTGRATGPHLHWALTWRGERIDPKLVAPAMAAAGGA